MNEVTMGGVPVTLIGEKVLVGDFAPDFEVLDMNMNKVKLSDYLGKPIVLTTFPSVDTGICAIQTNTFNAKIGKYKDKAQLLIISNDLPFALKRYCGVNGIDNAIVTSDYKDVEFSTKYGILIKENRLIARTTWIIDKNGKIIYKEIVPEIKSEPNYDRAIEVLENLL